MPDVQRYLREEEYHEYQMWKHWASLTNPRPYAAKAVAVLENLSAARALLKKFDDNSYDDGCPCCRKCRLQNHHDVNCAIAAQLAGVRGGK